MKHTGCLHFITLMNLLHLPTSVNCPQDIISHIQVVHRLQVKSMHSLIRVWFLNPFRLPSSQCEAYSQHLYKCQCCFVVDCILQILFSSYPISLSFDYAHTLHTVRIVHNAHITSIIALFQTSKQTKLSNKQSLFDRRVSNYWIINGLFKLYAANGEMLESADWNTVPCGRRSIRGTPLPSRA